MNDLLVANFEIAKIFREISVLSKLKQESPYLVQAYLEAAEFLESTEADVLKLDRKALVDLPTIGESMADMILEYGRTKFIKKLNTLRVELDELGESIAAQRKKCYGYKFNS